LRGDIEAFSTGHRETESTDLERILATVLFTDIVDSLAALPKWAIRTGVGCWTVTICWRARRLKDTVAT
jgi:hypothetical protein